MRTATTTTTIVNVPNILSAGWSVVVSKMLSFVHRKQRFLGISSEEFVASLFCTPVNCQFHFGSVSEWFCLSPLGFITEFSLFQEYEEPVYSYSTYPVRRSPRDIHNILKLSPPFASSEGVGGDRYQSDDAHRTQPPRHCLLSRCRVRTCCYIALTFSISFCSFLPYLSLFYFSFHPKSDISAL